MKMRVTSQISFVQNYQDSSATASSSVSATATGNRSNNNDAGAPTLVTSLQSSREIQMDDN